MSVVDNPSASLYEEAGAEFFAGWMDSRITMSCGLWGPEKDPAPDLETAQHRKLRTFAGLAGVCPGHRVVDIGSGFGGMLDYLARERQVSMAVGLNSSALQCQESLGQDLPTVCVRNTEYQDYVPTEPFDAAICVEMIEHLASAEDFAAGRHVGRYRDLLQRVHTWTRPGARFAIEATVIPSSTRRSEGEYEHLMADMQLAGLPPHLADLLHAADGLWEPLSIRTHRDDYLRTYDAWIDRIHSQQESARARWGKDLVDGNLKLIHFEREAFRAGTLSVAFLSLRRIDAPA
ncbi:class I SAM-dependent methyltransferase [Streptomyces sp. 891-h]|uniref:SAM-dependent methyltransferase n=1 Tax=Streptomyces sp. 891-h TaxID=2720714 RepID=UPI001FA9EF90|nr:class I SAM-dependent methyltransferase [Streptomyces sp. 891-h]UNZ21041.1 methyltransferase domain-containing protein [Streptomyces sp. 891-h]